MKKKHLSVYRHHIVGFNQSIHVYTHLPVQDRSLPLGDFVNVLQPSLPLVDLLGDVPHDSQCSCHISIVTADKVCT